MSARPLWLLAAPTIFVCLWSGGFIAAKAGLTAAEPLTFLLIRFALVTALMAVVFAVMRPPLPKTRAGWGHLIIVGLLMQVFYFGLTYLAFDLGTAAATVALILAFQPILVALLAPASTGQRVDWRTWAGLMIGLVGTAIVIVSRAAIAEPPLMGLIYTVLALAAMIAAVLWEKRFGEDQHPVTQNLIGFGAAFLFLLPVALLLETQTIDWTVDLGLSLAYLVLGNSLVATTLLLAMIRHGEVARVSALLFLVPPLSALLAWMLLGEFLPPLAWVGMAIAATGVVVATRR